LAVADEAGLDEDRARLVFDDPAGLDEAHRAALELADALMTRPDSLSADTITTLRSHFTERQLVELTLDVMKWNYQKVSVATGTDLEMVPGTLAPLRFDNDGHFIRPE
jgi:hypothetical protein